MHEAARSLGGGERVSGGRERRSASGLLAVFSRIYDVSLAWTAAILSPMSREKTRLVRGAHRKMIDAIERCEAGGDTPDDHVWAIVDSDEFKPVLDKIEKLAIALIADAREIKHRGHDTRAQHATAASANAAEPAHAGADQR